MMRAALLLISSMTLAGTPFGAGAGEDWVPDLGSSIQGSIYWYVSETPLLCAVIPLEGGKSTGENVLVIYALDHGKYRERFRSKPEEKILGMYPVGGDHPRLLTIWGAGDHFDVRAFADVGGSVKEVLDDGSRIPPEVVYGDADSRNESVLLTDLDWVKTDPKSPSRLLPAKTRVYRWTGDKYSMTVVSWADRVSQKEK